MRGHDTAVVRAVALLAQAATRACPSPYAAAERVGEGGGGEVADPRDRRHRRRPDGAREAEARRLGEAPLGLSDLTDLTAEPDLADDDRRSGQRALGACARDREGDREIDTRLGDTHSAGDAGIHVGAADRDAGPLLEHREEQREARGVEPGRRAARHRRLRGRNECLHLDEQRPASLEHGGDHRARDVGPTIGEEQRRRVGDVGEPVAAHLEHTELARRAEPVLHRTQEAQPVMPVAVEREHGVDHVLEGARAGERALLGDMTDEQRGHGARLREGDECGRAVANLRDRAGNAREGGVGDGLDRVDGQHIGFHLLDMGHDLVE